MQAVQEQAGRAAEQVAEKATKVAEPLDLQSFFNLLLQKLETWAKSAVAHLPNFVVAVVTLLVFVAIARFVARQAERLARHTKASPAIVALTVTFVRLGVILVGLFVALGMLGLEKTVLSLLAGAGVVGLALGFAFQDLASNLIAGVVMGFRKPFTIGDHIRTNSFEGNVRAIDLRNTTIETFGGQHVILPNKDVFEQALTNYSITGLRRVDFAVGVAYGTDLEEATQAIEGAIRSLPFLVPDKPVMVFTEGFGASSIDFHVFYWYSLTGDYNYLSARHAGILAIKKALDERDIEIPFPIRTLTADRSFSEAFAAANGKRPEPSEAP